MEAPLTVKNGMAHVHDAIGTGVSWNEIAVESLAS